MLQLSEKQK
jgi:hypothetical protein